MAIPTTIESLSTTAASNGPSENDDLNTADDGLRQAYAFIRQTVTLGSNIASASTITPPSTGSVFNVTGTTTITTIASTNSWDGRIVTFIFAGALTLTHSSNLALPGSANITTAANDIATFVQTASGAWRLTSYRTSGGNETFRGTTITVGKSGTNDPLVISSQSAGSGPVIFATDTTGASYSPLTIDFSTLALRSSANTALSISANRNVTINAPSSGYGLNIPTGTPASAGASGTAGDIAWDSSYIYVCTATNTWKRAALSTW